MSHLFIHPGFDPFYSSFYLQGLWDTFGQQHIRYTTWGFPQLSKRQMVFIAPDGLKIVIDNYDSSSIKEKDALEWCDCYAKINLDRERVAPALRHKLMSIGPSFGVRLWSRPGQWLAAALWAHWRSRGQIGRPNLHYTAYRRLSRLRLPITDYVPEPGQKNTVFFVTRLRQSTPDANAVRAAFIRECLALPELEGEAFFVAKANEPIPPEYKPIIRPTMVPMSDYLRNLKRSVAAFNTPSVHQCHGWKLGEFLALGKAIISTPLVYELPAPLVHGQHIHFVDGSPEALRQALQKINADDSYRRLLERNARTYYDTYLAPRTVIEQILATARTQHMM